MGTGRVAGIRRTLAQDQGVREEAAARGGPGDPSRRAPLPASASASTSPSASMVLCGSGFLRHGA